MEEEIKKKIEKAIAACADKAEQTHNAIDAQQFAQAATNLSNVIIGLTNLNT